MEILGKGLVIAGFIAFFSGHFWMVSRAFHRSVFWGLAVLFVPGGPIGFLFQRWTYAKHPFLIRLVGIALLLTGGFVLSDS
jgi:hypothetical protein